MKLPTFNLLDSFILIFVIAGVFIGVLVTAQFKSVVAPNSYLTDELKAQKDLLMSYDRDRTLLKAQVASMRSQIDENQKKLELDSENVDVATFDELRKAIGITATKGPGLEIILTDGPVNNTDNSGLVHAADLRDVVNVLRTGKAEAIAINGQRIIFSTPINSVGNTILINNVHISAPFKIHVIGDAELILDRIKDEKAYPDLYKRIQSQKVNFSVKNLEQLSIPIYDGEFLLKYTKKT